MKKLLVIGLTFATLAGISYGLLTFYMVDNFEDGTISKWYVFNNVQASVVNNPAVNSNDSVSESCGDKSLKIVGLASNWYAGGIGTLLDVDGSSYTRFVFDVYGSRCLGKVKVEIFEKKTASSTQESKWVVDLPVLGEGFTRYSIPFSAFSSDDPKSAVFHGRQAGRISKLQLIMVASSEKGNIDLTVDNLIFTF